MATSPVGVALATGADSPVGANLCHKRKDIIGVEQGEELRFATDSPLEGGAFEPSVPLYGELGALGGVRREPRRHREARNARSFASTRSASDLRHAWGRTKPGSRSARRLRASGSLIVRLLGKVRDLSGRSDCRQGQRPK